MRDAFPWQLLSSREQQRRKGQACFCRSVVCKPEECCSEENYVCEHHAYPLKVLWFLYVPSPLTRKNSCIFAIIFKCCIIQTFNIDYFCRITSFNNTAGKNSNLSSIVSLNTVIRLVFIMEMQSCSLRLRD